MTQTWALSIEPRHGGPIGVGTFALVFVCFPALWRSPLYRWRGIAIACVGRFIAGGFVLSDPTRFGASIEGLGQRLLALGALVPIASLAVVSAAQIRSKTRSQIDRPAAAPFRS